MSSSLSDVRSRDMAPTERAVLVFMRVPEAGQVKSRLATGVGVEEAARIYQIMVRRTLGVLSDFKRSRPEVTLFVFFTPADRVEILQKHYPGPWLFLPQVGHHLGDRMDRALRQVFALGFHHAVLVGTDLAHPEGAILEDAFRALGKGLTPLGPARDGGFYLVGLHRPCSSPFQFEEWGTDTVYGRTEKSLAASGLQVLKLKEKQDVDRPEDFELLRDHFFFKEKLSIVIPTVRPPEAVSSFLHRLEPQLWPGDEIVVALSEGITPPRNEEESASIRWIVSPRGRGIQLNAGARATEGSILLFLHDDSVPPHQFAYQVRKIAQDPAVSIGCFQLAFSPSTPALDLVSRWANLRTDLFGLPYGDQGLFCRRTVFWEAGGFRNPFLMEDVDFVRQCKKRGRLLKIPDSIHTSPHRYLKRGLLRASLQNHCLMLLYFLGMSNRGLYKLYYGCDPQEPDAHRSGMG